MILTLHEPRTFRQLVASPGEKCIIRGKTEENLTLTSRWIGWLTLSGLPLLAFPPPPPKHFIHGIPRPFSRLSVALYASILLPPRSLPDSRLSSANPSRFPRLSASIRDARSRTHLGSTLAVPLSAAKSMVVSFLGLSLANPRILDRITLSCTV